MSFLIKAVAKKMTFEYKFLRYLFVFFYKFCVFSHITNVIIGVGHKNLNDPI